MKLTGARAANFLRSPDREVRGILFYGPDSGLVRERGEMLVHQFMSDDDPFSMTEISGDQLKQDSALLSDQSRGLSLMGGDPVVRVRDITDTSVKVIEGWLLEPKFGNPVIFEAGELSARSKLRLLFEKRDDTAAIACYPDEGRNLSQTVREHLSANGVQIDGPALGLLTSRLGADRMAVRQELDKLVTYAWAESKEERALGVDDVEALTGDSSEDSLDQIAFAVAGGDLEQLLAGFSGAWSGGQSEIAVIRMVQRHFDRLMSARAGVDSGQSVEAAIKSLRPPVFFKFSDSMKRQVMMWGQPDIVRALNLLVEAEAACKSGVGVETAISERALVQVAMAARRKIR